MSDMSLHVDKSAKSKPAKAANFAPSSSPPESGGLNMPDLELPPGFREYAESGMAQAKENFERLQTATEQVTSAFEATFATSAKGLADYGLKLIEAAHVNTNAAFGFARKLMAAKSPSEAVEVATEHARLQYDMLSNQNRELLALAQKIAADAVAPIRKLQAI